MGVDAVGVVSFCPTVVATKAPGISDSGMVDIIYPIAEDDIMLDGPVGIVALIVVRCACGRLPAK
jgi:hypothetical protein